MLLEVFYPFSFFWFSGPEVEFVLSPVGITSCFRVLAVYFRLVFSSAPFFAGLSPFLVRSLPYQTWLRACPLNSLRMSPCHFSFTFPLFPTFPFFVYTLFFPWSFLPCSVTHFFGAKQPSHWNGVHSVPPPQVPLVTIPSFFVRSTNIATWLVRLFYGIRSPPGESRSFCHSLERFGVTPSFLVRPKVPAFFSPKFFFHRQGCSDS